MRKESRDWAMVLMLLSLALPAPGLALDYPTKPIQVVVGMAAGGPSDLSTRIIAEEASKELGVPVVVVNKPGAAGSVAASLVAKAKKDGYTISTGGAWAICAVYPFMPDTPYTLSDFLPIAKYISLPVVIAVRADSPWKSFRDFVEDARRTPGKYKSGSDGGGSSLIWEAVIRSSNLEVVHVVYKGAAPNSTALLGAHVDISSVALTPIWPQVDAQKLRILAVLGRSRMKAFPEVPTLTELGHTDGSREFWHGLLAPAGTPQVVVEKLSEAVKKALSNPAVNEQLEKIGVVPAYQGPKEFGAFLREEYEQFMQLGKKYKLPQ
jgi:tripartite-type tricarboxylate transporter receptor subunit TctC